MSMDFLKANSGIFSVGVTSCQADMIKTAFLRLITTILPVSVKL